VAGADPARKIRTGIVALAGRNNLLLRVASSLVLAPLALAAAYLGGPVFLALWAIVALGVLWEWDTLVCTHDRNPILALGAAALIGASLLLAFDWSGTAIALVLLGVLGVATLATRSRRGWCAGGLVYAAAMLVAPVVLRGDAGWGLAAILFVFVVVWLTDITAYFVGRTVGGPKLSARVSPNKTWSGAIGGTVAAIAGGLLVARLAGIANFAAIGAVAFALSVASQAGDLLESAIKRQFSAKDASSLIPGHGGLMDRLDGFVAAVVAAALIGIARGGFGAPARGLMVW
jgi:phosphatidate cytidylyltransferase